jgi:very-short-patch-repair endonuclease
VGATKPGARPADRLAGQRIGVSRIEGQAGTQAPDATPLPSQDRGSRAGSTIHSLPVESDGANLGDHVLDKPALNPFEIDVRDTLLRHGLKLTAQYGTSGYWIDFALQHPTQPGRYVLAIECDGATYHSSRSARDRDRLRQEQLERHGWRFHRIWSAEWFHDKNACTEKAIAAYHAAVQAADEGEQDALAHDPDDGEPGTLLQTAYEAALSRTTPAPPAPGQRMGPRPWIIRGQPIEAYSDTELLRLAQWIRSDDILRTEDELLQEMMHELGFQRRGKNVVARLTAAITQSAANAPGHHGLPRRLQAGAAAYRRAGPVQSGRAGFGAFRGQRKSKTRAYVGEDQHTNNTNKTALPGTRRHGCHNDRAGPVTSKDAG